MRVDIGNCLAPAVSPGVTEAALERLDDRVATAHARIERGIDADEHGYAALGLPATVDPARIRAAVDGLADPAHLLVVGIGGSALGAATLAAALHEGGLGGGPAYPGTDPPSGAAGPVPTATGATDPPTAVHVLDNVDPAETRRVLAAVDPAATTVVVVSRSGTTAETLANFAAVRDRFGAAGVDWTDRTIAVTGPEGPLRRAVDRHDLPSLPAPGGVPGRFGVLSAVGLVPAAVLDLDVEAVLAGAREAADGLAGSLFDCPAYAYGATTYALAVRGAGVNAVMPYAERLETFGEWFGQLWAESLGKEERGQVPARALGATDQHSQLQLYRAGPREVVTTFVTPRERPSLRVGDRASGGPGDRDGDGDGGGDGEGPAGEYAFGFDFDGAGADPGALAAGEMGALLDAELAGTEASLAAAGRPNLRVELDRVDARSLGRLLYGMEAACVLAGELADLGPETFRQPAVEFGKRATRGLLGAGGDPEREAAETVAGKRTLLVE